MIKPDFELVKDVIERIDSMCQYSLHIRALYQAECLDIAQKAHQLSIKNSYLKGEAHSLSIIGFVHWNISEIDKGQEEVEAAYSMMLSIEEYDLIGDTAMVRAMAIWGKGQYDRAFSVVYETLNLIEEKKIAKGGEWLYWCLGVFYYDLKDFEKSLDNHKKADKEIKLFDNPDMAFYSYITIGLGSANKALHNYKKALYYFNQAFEAIQNKDHWLQEARVYYELGTIKEIQKSYKVAEDYFLKSYEMRKAHSHKPGMVSSLIALSDLKLVQDQDTEAMGLLSEALQYAEETNSKPKVYFCHEKLSDLYKKIGDYQNAYEHMKKFYSIKSEVAGEQASNTLKDLETKYATEKSEKEKEIHRLKNIELKKAHDDIAGKNKEIQDSINYARRIQEAILPPEQLIKSHFRESFILYKPKDIVAGDFYWYDKIDDEIYIAAADCTGHGVPGAMVSVVCSNALNRVVNEMKITEPKDILDKVRELVVETFDKSKEDVKDGMDISFCKLNLKTKQLTYAGAHNSLYRVTTIKEKYPEKTIINKSHMLLEYKGDKQPIGKFAFSSPFNQIEIQLEADDSIYLSSDGYPDQFGGEKNRKFMYKRFKELILSIKDYNMVDQHKVLDDSFNIWKGDDEQVDDVCVIGIKV